METIKVFLKLDKEKLLKYPSILFSNLYQKAVHNFYYEFILDKKKYLISSFYTVVGEEKNQKLNDFIEGNESFLDLLKEYITVSLFVYSAIVEENSYYISSSGNVLICRIVHISGSKFELRFYSHDKSELLTSYNDKIYIGRDFIDLEKFERESLGLIASFNSLLEQSKKIQERAKHKLKNIDKYQKPYLDEIKYMTAELVSEALDRVEYMNATKISDIPVSRMNEMLDNLIYIQNLMIETKAFLSEFENELRRDKENVFVKYITKFSKDVKGDIRYLRKLSLQFHLKISKFLN